MNKWTKSGETWQYERFRLLGLSKTTLQFRVVSVQIRICTFTMQVRSVRCYALTKCMKWYEEETKRQAKVEKLNEN
jgi:hypothetical protein